MTSSWVAALSALMQHAAILVVELHIYGRNILEQNVSIVHYRWFAVKTHATWILPRAALTSLVYLPLRLSAILKDAITAVSSSRVARVLKELMEMFSALLTLCDGNNCGLVLPITMGVSPNDLLNTVEVPMICEATTLMWRYHNAHSNVKNLKSTFLLIKVYRHLWRHNSNQWPVCFPEFCVNVMLMSFVQPFQQHFNTLNQSKCLSIG